MYVQKQFAEQDRDKIIALVNEYSFSTLITCHEGEPFVSHLPLLVDEREALYLSGHMARANEQWQHFQENSEVLAVFQGPHTYISPSHYETPGVPTWNYAAVHMYGRCRLLEEPNDVKYLISELTNKYEKSQPQPWRADYPDRLLSMIVGFEIEVVRIEAKFKLSQNRPQSDRRNIIDNLAESQSEGELGIVKLMSGNE